MTKLIWPTLVLLLAACGGTGEPEQESLLPDYEQIQRDYDPSRVHAGASKKPSGVACGGGFCQPGDACVVTCNYNHCEGVCESGSDCQCYGDNIDCTCNVN